jgi:hypothetical protein
LYKNNKKMKERNKRDKLFVRNVINSAVSISVHVSTVYGLLDSVSLWQHRRRVVQASPGALTPGDAADDDLPSCRYRFSRPESPLLARGGGGGPLVVAFTRSVGPAEKGGLVAPTTSLTRN